MRCLHPVQEVVVLRSLVMPDPCGLDAVISDVNARSAVPATLGAGKIGGLEKKKGPSVSISMGERGQWVVCPICCDTSSLHLFQAE